MLNNFSNYVVIVGMETPTQTLALREREFMGQQ